MPGPPQAVEESHNGDAKGKTENYYLTHKFTTRESISAWQRLQQWGQKLHGPFLTAILLTTVEMSARAMVASPEKYPVTTQITLLLSFLWETQGPPPLPAPPFLHTMYHNSSPLVYPVPIVISFDVYEVIRVCKLLLFLVYKLIECRNYTVLIILW